MTWQSILIKGGVIDQLLFDVCSHIAVYYFISGVNWP